MPWRAWRRVRWLAAGGPACSRVSEQRFRKRGLLGPSLFSIVLFEIVLVLVLVLILPRWDGVTSHAMFGDLQSAMPPEVEGRSHQWKRDSVRAALVRGGKLTAAGNLFWGGNPLQNMTASAELLCWKEASLSVVENCLSQPQPQSQLCV